MKVWLPRLLLVLAVGQFCWIALPPGNADLISIQSLALDLAHGEKEWLYPGKGFSRNEGWVAHHERNLAVLKASGEPNWCFYPPLVPWLFVPAVKLSPEVWRLVWGIIQFGLVALFIVITGFLIRSSGSRREWSWVWTAVLILGSFPVARTLQLGQTSLFLAVLLWGGVLLGFRGKGIIRAVAVGVVAYLKPFLLFGQVPELMDRNLWSLLLSFGIVILLTVCSILLLGPAVNGEYVTFLSTLSESQTAFQGNWSLLAGLLRLVSDLPVTDYGFSWSPESAVWSRVFLLVMLAAAGWAQVRSRRTDPVASTGLWISAVLLGLPISWEHHLVFILPVLAWLWMKLDGRIERIIIGTATVLLAVNLQPLVTESFPGRFISVLPVIGHIILFVLLVLFHVGKNRGTAAAHPVSA